MRLRILLAAALTLLGSMAQAQTAGVAVQVSNGKRIPTVDQLRIVLNSGDFVRDVLGWHKADLKCDLRTNPSLPIAIPAAFKTLYDNVAEAGGRNFVTLAFNNKNCGQLVNSGAKAFPNTPELRAEFAAYAVRVVKQVPALGGVSLWNEMNGTWNGGYDSRAQKLTDYCLLANEVVREIRKVDSDIPIAIGASVGWDIDAWFIDMFERYGCLGKGDPTIWLDVHPYLSSKRFGNRPDWQLWNESIGRIRARGIDNPLIATEWGAKSAYTFTQGHPNSNYMKIFRDRVLLGDPGWAAFVWFEMLYDSRMPNAGLFDATGALNDRGVKYVNEFVD